MELRPISATNAPNRTCGFSDRMKDRAPTRFSALRAVRLSSRHSSRRGASSQDCPRAGGRIATTRLLGGDSARPRPRQRFSPRQSASKEWQDAPRATTPSGNRSPYARFQHRGCVERLPGARAPGFLDARGASHSDHYQQLRCIILISKPDLIVHHASAGETSRYASKLMPACSNLRLRTVGDVSKQQP